MDSRWISFRGGASEGGMRERGRKERSMHACVYGRMDGCMDSQIRVNIHDQVLSLESKFQREKTNKLIDR